MSQTTKEAYGRMRRYSLNLSRYYQTPMAQMSLSVVLSLFVVAFFIVVALKPTFTTIVSLKKEVGESEKTLKQLKTKTDTMQQATKIWEKIKPELDYVEAGIPSTSVEYQSLTKKIEALASASGVKITGETIGKGVLYSRIAKIYGGRKREIIEVELTARVSGSYPQIVQFLDKLLSIDRLIRIDTITISKGEAVENQADVGLSLTGSVQYLANSKEVQKIVGRKKGRK